MDVSLSQRKKALKVFALILPIFLIQLINGFYLPLIATHAGWFWANDLITYMLLPSLAFLGLQKLAINPEQYGFPQRKFDADLIDSGLKIVLLCFIAWFFSYVLTQMLWRYVPSEMLFSYQAVVPANPLLAAITVTFFGISAGLVESVIYLGLARLLINTCLPKAWQVFAFVGIVPLLFAAVHWEQNYMGVLVAYLIQVSFAMLYLRWKYLPPFIISHALIDFVAYA
jgi:hypothetical protein